VGRIRSRGTRGGYARRKQGSSGKKERGESGNGYVPVRGGGIGRVPGGAREGGLGPVVNRSGPQPSLEGLLSIGTDKLPRVYNDLKRRMLKLSRGFLSSGQTNT